MMNDEDMLALPFVRSEDDLPAWTDLLTSPRMGPVAVGLDLNAELMLEAYSRGIFAWSIRPVTWWSPDPRAVMNFEEFHISRSLRKLLRQQRYQVTLDQSFEEVVEGCAAKRLGQEGTWIETPFRKSFLELYAQGWAHSVEVWKDHELVGGIFGVALRGLFAGESMFFRASNASKVGFAYLMRALSVAGFSLVDLQVVNDHTLSLGAREIPRILYLQRLAQALSYRPKALSSVRFDQFEW